MWSNRTLDRHITGKGRRHAKGESHGTGIVAPFQDRAGGVHMTAHQVSAQRRGRREGAFEVDPVTRPQLADGGAGKGLRRHVGVKARRAEGVGGQADAINGHGIANPERRLREHIPINAQTPIGTMLLEPTNFADGLNNSRKHARDYDQQGSSLHTSPVGAGLPANLRGQARSYRTPARGRAVMRQSLPRGVMSMTFRARPWVRVWMWGR